jgi:hypothetical protein
VKRGNTVPLSIALGNIARQSLRIEVMGSQGLNPSYGAEAASH